jgi:hypothetical protein
MLIASLFWGCSTGFGRFGLFAYFNHTCTGGLSQKLKMRFFIESFNGVSHGSASRALIEPSPRHLNPNENIKITRNGFIDQSSDLLPLLRRQQPLPACHCIKAFMA